MARLSTGAGSKQDYQTPRNFIEAVERRFGKISFDLAASAHNTQHDRYFAAPGDNDLLAEGYDSLAQDWLELATTVPEGSIMWLNPPFKRITPWARKCFEFQEAIKKTDLIVDIGFLVPASVGANWYRDYLFEKTCTKFLNGRICFDGKDLFPKDCLFGLFGPGHEPDIKIWEWQKPY